MTVVVKRSTHHVDSRRVVASHIPFSSDNGSVVCADSTGLNVTPARIVDIYISTKGIYEDVTIPMTGHMKISKDENAVATCYFQGGDGIATYRTFVANQDNGIESI